MNKFQFFKSLMSRLYYYFRGVIHPLAGNFAAYKYSGTTATLTKNADNLQISLVTAQGWGYDTTPIDLTNIRTLRVYGSCAHTTNGALVTVAPTYTAITYSASAQLPNGGANAWVSIDVTSLTGLHYVRFGRFASAATLVVNVYEIVGEA